MPKHYVTFGQVHRHTIGNKIFDKDCVARFDAPNAAAGRQTAFDLFGGVFCFEYHGDEWERKEQKNLSYFPRGYVDINLGPNYAPPHNYRRVE